MNFIKYLDDLLGINKEILSISHLIFRSLIVYLLGIILSRLNRRFISMRTASNFFLFIFIGSILATAIVGQIFYEIIIMVIFIMFINWSILVLNYNFPALKKIIEGKSILLIENGKIQHKAMRRYLINEVEIIAQLRIQTNSSDISKVEKAFFENSGQISFVLKER